MNGVKTFRPHTRCMCSKTHFILPQPNLSPSAPAWLGFCKQWMKKKGWKALP